jgi:hypothetical protein
MDSARPAMTKIDPATKRNPSLSPNITDEAAMPTTG